MRRWYGRQYVLAGAMLLAVILVPGRDEAQIFRNESGEPVFVANISDRSGMPYAKLFATGEEVQLAGGWIARGAGYVEAVEGRSYAVIVKQDVDSQLVVVGLHMGKIEWDEKGYTIEITDLEPEIEIVTGRQDDPKRLEILSHSLKEGVFRATLAGRPGREYEFGILYGKGLFFRPNDIANPNPLEATGEDQSTPVDVRPEGGWIGTRTILILAGLVLVVLVVVLTRKQRAA